MSEFSSACCSGRSEQSETGIHGNRWQMSAGSFSFSWNSKILKLIPHQIIQWESIDGLPNRGAIRFYDRSQGNSVVKLSVAYNIPGIIGKLMDGLFLGRIVESTIQADMERFRNYAIEADQKFKL